jgi:hypothetical protein
MAPLAIGVLQRFAYLALLGQIPDADVIALTAGEGDRAARYPGGGDGSHGFGMPACRLPNLALLGQVSPRSSGPGYCQHWPTANSPLDDAASWPVVVTTPGNDPIGELARHIPELGEQSPEQPNEATVRSTGWTDVAVRSAVVRYAKRHVDHDARIVLIVDQFEETFTPCQHKDQRAGFIRALHAASSPPRLAVPHRRWSC